MRRDRIANERIIQFIAPDVVANGASNSAEYDLRAGPAGAVFNGREMPTNVMFIVGFGTEADGETLDIIVHTGDVSGALTSYATLGTMTHAGVAALWLAEVSDLQRYIQIYCTVDAGGGNGTELEHFVIGSFNRARREPIFQAGTEVAVTYNKNPATG